MSMNLFQVALPIVAGQVFAFFGELLNILYIGRLGDPVLTAAVGLGNMYANITCLIVVYGLNQTISTLCS